MDIYECVACGTSGTLNDFNYEETDEGLECRECNGGGEICIQSELREHEKMVAAARGKSKLSDALEGFEP